MADEAIAPQTTPATGFPSTTSPPKFARGLKRLSKNARWITKVSAVKHLNEMQALAKAVSLGQSSELTPCPAS